MTVFDLSNSYLLAGAIALFIFWALGIYPFSKKKNLPYPPGPKGLPLIGNALDIPQEAPWLAFRDYCAKFGDIVHLKPLGQHMIILGSAQAAFDLLDKRSAIYSDRPRSPIVALTDWEWSLGLMPYGQWWRRTRKTFHHHFHQGVVSKYQHVQLKEARKLLVNLLARPEAFGDHVRFSFGATILKAVYGIDVKDSKDRFIELAEKAVGGSVEAFTPGAFWVEFLPILRYVPAWFPGATFQKKFAEWAQESRDLKELPFSVAKKAFQSGSTDTDPSVASEMIEELSHLEGNALEEEEDIAKNVAAIAYAAGADTTTSTMHTFLLAMTLYPEVQKRAQKELDAVVGPTRLPEFEDRDSLPYITAITKECLRWLTVAPFGVPHSASEDDEYKGYLIPKGSLILPNIWAFLHDPEVYPAPNEFRPDRYITDGRLNSEIRDPATAAFGFGRRVCPGRHFSEASFFINVASVLHTFNISPPVDESGRLVELVPEVTSGFVCYPKEFKCTIKARSATTEALIRNAERAM